MKCARCGVTVPDGAAACPGCGSPVIVTAPAAARPASAGKVRRYAAAAGVAGVIFVLALCNGVFFLDIAVGSPVGLVLSVIAALLPAIFYSNLVILLDRYEREPALVLFGTFIWGALVATLVSIVFNSLFEVTVSAALGQDAGEVLTAAVSAPLVEETSKGAVLFLLYLFLRREFDNVLDGIVYGSLVGIGFAMTENVMYFGTEYLETGLIGLGVVFYIRAILGSFGHAAYTAATGAGLGFARESLSGFVKVVAPLLGLALAMLQHFAWNFFVGFVFPARFLGPEPAAGDVLVWLFLVSPLLALLFTGPAILVLLGLVFAAWHRETRIIAAHLREEVVSGVVTPEEFSRLTSSRLRLRAELRALKSGGVGTWRRQRQLHQAATELAFRKWHLSRGESPKNAQRYTTEQDYRARIRQLRGGLAVEGEPEVAPV